MPRYFLGYVLRCPESTCAVDTQIVANPKHDGESRIVYFGIAVAGDLQCQRVIVGVRAAMECRSIERPSLVNPLLAGNAAASDTAKRRRMVFQFSDRPKLGALRPCRREHGSAELC